MNEYATRDALKTLVGVTGTGDDTLMGLLMTRASRMWDGLTRRTFHEVSETKSFDYESAQLLMFGRWDLLSLTTLTNGDATVISSDDYVLYPLSGYPKLWVELDVAGGEIFQYATTPQAAITIAGLWGYHTDYSNAWASSGDAVVDDPLTAAATTLNVTAGTHFEVQQTIKVGSEQLYISAIATNALTVSRGVNGTTAAEHAAAAAITIWAPDAEVVHFALRLGSWLYRLRDTGFQQVAVPGLGSVAVPGGVPEDVMEAAMRYRRVVV